jgi:K+-sensing histidine kinase KdpD
MSEIASSEEASSEDGIEPKWFSEPKTLSQLLSGMGHEIRTPISSLLGFTELLRDPNLTEEDRQKYLNILARNGQQLQNIVDDLLNLAKIEAGHFRTRTETLCFKSLVQDTISRFQFEIKKRSLKIVLYPTAIDFPKILSSDSERIQRILSSLLECILRFAKAEIYVNLETSDDNVVIRMSFVGNPIGSMAFRAISAKTLAEAIGGCVKIYEKENTTVVVASFANRKFPAIRAHTAPSSESGARVSWL